MPVALRSRYRKERRRESIKIAVNIPVLWISFFENSRRRSAHEWTDRVSQRTGRALAVLHRAVWVRGNFFSPVLHLFLHDGSPLQAVSHRLGRS